MRLDRSGDAELHARLLVPLTRGPGGAALQFEVQLNDLEQLEHVRHRGGSGHQRLDAWFSEILQFPPEVEILRVDEMPAS